MRATTGLLAGLACAGLLAAAAAHASDAHPPPPQWDLGLEFPDAASWDRAATDAVRQRMERDLRMLFHELA